MPLAMEPLKMRCLLDKTKQVLPPGLKGALRPYKRRIAEKWARTSGLLPDFIIIGGQKCGTTSLYRYLVQHPDVYPALRKEIGFFNARHEHDLGWYRAHFPSKLEKFTTERIRHRQFMTGEADPAYILDPFALEAIKNTIPHVKIIILLRNPADRAFSHYQHSARVGVEKLDFEEALAAENKRISRQWSNMMQGRPYHGLTIYHFAYLKTGHYGDQLEGVYRVFKPEQVLVLQSEAFFANTQYYFEKVLKFLGLSVATVDIRKKHNKGNYNALDERMRRRLEDYFGPQLEKMRLFTDSINFHQYGTSPVGCHTLPDRCTITC